MVLMPFIMHITYLYLRCILLLIMRRADHDIEIKYTKGSFEAIEGAEAPNYLPI
jgi:hypothetical protein